MCAVSDYSQNLSTVRCQRVARPSGIWLRKIVSGGAAAASDRLARAGMAARELGYSEQTIQEVQAMPVVEMAHDEWPDEMRSAERRIRRCAR